MLCCRRRSHGLGAFRFHRALRPSPTLDKVEAPDVVASLGCGNVLFKFTGVQPKATLVVRTDVEADRRLAGHRLCVCLVACLHHEMGSVCHQKPNQEDGTEPDYRREARLRLNGNVGVTRMQTMTIRELIIILFLLPCVAVAQETNTEAVPVPPQIELTDTGWIYFPRGRYVILEQQGKSTANSRFQICGNNVVVHTGLGKAKPESTNGCEIVALSLPEGHVVYQHPATFETYPFDALGMWPWVDKAVLWGHCPKFKTHVIAIIDSTGKLARSFAIGSLMRPLAIDELNSTIICLGQRESVTGAQPTEDELPPQYLYALKLPDGARGKYLPIRLLVDAICDRDGSVYLIRYVEGLSKTQVERTMALKGYDVLLEKYVAATWEKVWSVRVDRVQNKGTWPCMMVKPDGNLVWFAIQDEIFHRKWKGLAYDALTGKMVREDSEFRPFRHTVNSASGRYFVELDQRDREDCIRVTKEKSTANK